MTERGTETERQRDRERETERDRDTERQRERQRETERETQRDKMERETERDTDRDRDRKTDIAHLKQVGVGLAPVFASLLPHVPVEPPQQEVVFPPARPLAHCLQEAAGGEGNGLSATLDVDSQATGEKPSVLTHTHTHLCSASCCWPWASCASPLSVKP